MAPKISSRKSVSSEKGQPRERERGERAANRHAASSSAVKDNALIKKRKSVESVSSKKGQPREKERGERAENLNPASSSAVKDNTVIKKRKSVEKTISVGEKSQLHDVGRSSTNKTKKKVKKVEIISSVDFIRGRPELKRKPDEFKSKYLLNMSTAKGCHEMISLIAFGRELYYILFYYLLF